MKNSQPFPIVVFALMSVCLCWSVGCKPALTPAPPATAAKPPVPPDAEESIQGLEAIGAKLRKDGDGNVIEVDLRGTEATDDSLGLLGGLPKVRSLLLNDTAVTNAGLVRVGPIGTLTNLDLRGCKVTDTGIASLSDLTNLRALRFSGRSGQTDVTDDAMETIGKLTGLKVLALDFLKFAGSAEGLEQLGGLTEIEELLLGNTLVNDDSLRVITTQFPKLKKLRVAASQVSSMGLEHVAKMSNLEDLDLSENSQIFDDGLEQLATMKQLKKLNLWRVQVTDEGVRHLAGLTNLESLNLDNVGYLSDEGLVHLKDLTKLTFLHLGSTAITDTGLPHLEPLTALVDLKVTRTGVTEEGVSELQKKLSTTKIQLKYIEGQ